MRQKRQPEPKSKNINNSGYAMLAVLVFLTLILVLGAGILTLADATVKQSRTLGLNDNLFYSAESALQVYVQLIEEKVRAVKIISDPHAISYSALNTDAIEDKRSDHLTDIKNELQTIYGDIKPAEGGSLGIAIDFYLGEVRLDLDALFHSPEELELIGDTQDQIIVEYEKIMAEDPDLEGNYEGEIWTAVAFYPTKAITYRVTATMGGRTLVAYLEGVVLEEGENSPGGMGDAVPDFGKVEFDRPEGGFEIRDEILYFGAYDGGAYFHANNTNVYQALEKNADGSYKKNGSDYSWITIEAEKKLESYNSLTNQLRYVIAETDALTRDKVLGNIPASDGRWVAITNQNEQDAKDAQYIKATGNYTLTGNYPDLEYLEIVNGKLTISGITNCPKLKGVYVGGASGTEAITISKDAQFNGNGSAGGTVFLTKGRDIVLYTSSSTITILFNGKFLASGGNVLIDVNGGGSASNKSNSMFVATKNGVVGSDNGKLTTIGQNFRMAAYSAQQVPQYYAENELILHVQNKQASFEGIFATLSDKYIFDDSVDKRNLKGIFVGNCNDITGNIRVSPFNPAQADKMLPGGLFDAEGGKFVVMPGEVAVPPGDGKLEIGLNDVNFGGRARLVIRETTGDRPLS